MQSESLVTELRQVKRHLRDATVATSTAVAGLKKQVAKLQRKETEQVPVSSLMEETQMGEGGTALKAKAVLELQRALEESTRKYDSLFAELRKRPAAADADDDAAAADADDAAAPPPAKKPRRRPDPPPASTRTLRPRKQS